jgi:LysR family transcriptional regulator (chromosome initiation inhibitor)
VRATEQGLVLLRAARQLTHLAADALVELHRSSTGIDGKPADPARKAGPSRVRIPIVANADSIATWLPPAVRALGTTAGLELDLRRDDETVTADLLRSGEVMAAITTDPTPVRGCSVRKLGAMTYRAKASRRFVRAWLAGPAASSLATAPVVHYDRKDRLQLRLLERVAPGATPPQHFVPDSVQFVEAIRAGVGWGMVPALQDPRDTLVTLDPDWTESVTLHWQAWRVTSPSLDLVTDAVTRAAQSHLH